MSVKNSLVEQEQQYVNTILLSQKLADPLPPHWRLARLEDICDITMGQSPPSSTYNTDGQGLPFLQGKTEFTDLCPIPTVYCTNPLKIAKQGSILISVRAPVGDVNLADQDYVIGRGLASIFLKDGANQFLFFSLLGGLPLDCGW